MASISIESAFENFPESSPASVLELLENFAARDPPASPKLRARQGVSSFVWPMDSSRFVVDEKRVDVSDGQAYIFESFLDEYGPEEVESRWNLAEPHKSDEDGLARLCSLVRKMASNCDLQETPRLLEVARKLVATISGHRHVEAAAGCLGALCTVLKKESDEIVASLKDLLAAAQNNLARRAAAMGLSAALKGLGLPSIKQYSMIDFLHQMMVSSTESRQSALFTYELLFRFFGYPFEPYVVLIAPHLLTSFDDVTNVRMAAERTAECIMCNLSSVAVSKLLPNSLSQLEARSTRLKCGATMCLGFLTRCNKRSLSVSLPVIVPALAQLVNDANNQVRALAASALDNIAHAIPNPEIGEMAPQLLGALSNPSEQTEQSIGTLMQCSYVHAVDTASLSFVMPILYWGLRDRKAETKRCAVQIVGTLVSLVQYDRDLVPYITELDPALRLLLGDAIPDTRLFAARAFSMMLQKYGESKFVGLVDWLVEQMATSQEQTVTDGATLGLAEALYALGIDKFDSMLPEIREKLTNPNPRVRCVFTRFLMQLPIKFPVALVPYITELNQFALRGFGDNALECRSAALQFGVQLVQSFYERAEELLLPTIETALWHSSASTQEAALVLLGYLLAKLAGEDELVLDPDEMQASDGAVNKVNTKDALRITEALGAERHDELLCCVCMLRSSPEEAVANMAGRVMRSLVEKISDKVDALFPRLMAMVIPMMLGGSSGQQALTAARCVGNLATTNKMLERVMLELCPLIQGAAGGEMSVDAHVGLLRAVREVTALANDKKLLSQEEPLCSAVQAGLMSGSEETRKMAGEIVVLMCDRVKMPVMNRVLPALVSAIEAEDPVGEPALTLLMGLKVKNSVINKAFQSYMKAHPSSNDFLDGFLQKDKSGGKDKGAAGESTKKKVKLPPKKAAKHDFVDPSKSKIKRTSKKLTKAEIAIQEEIQAMKKAEAIGNIKSKEQARLRKKGLG